MKDTLTTLANEVANQAAIAAVPGQGDELENIADRIRSLAKQNPDTAITEFYRTESDLDELDLA